MPLPIAAAPYLGGSIGAFYNDRDITGVIDPNAGLKLFFDEQAFLNLGYRYEYFFSRLKTSTTTPTAAIILPPSASVLCGAVTGQRTNRNLS